MSKIVIVTFGLNSWEKNSGATERKISLAEALKDHDITIVSLIWDSNGFDHNISKNIRLFHPAMPEKALKKYRILSKKYTELNLEVFIEVIKKELNPIQNIINDLANKSDLVILDGHVSGPMISDISKPIIYNAHNAEFYMTKEIYDDETSLRLIKKIEGDVLRKSSAITYCSKKDLSMIENEYNYNKISCYIPNGSTNKKNIDAFTKSKSKNIIFIGTMHPPNVVAVKNIIKIARICNDKTFTIIGGVDNSIDKSSLPDNVIFTGYIEQNKVDEYFSNAFAFINPVETGSGTHLKNMLALSHGLPILTSKVGARGFEEDEIMKSMIICDIESDFVDAITKLENMEFFSSLSNGCLDVFKKYDWEEIKKSYSLFVDSLIN